MLVVYPGTRESRARAIEKASQSNTAASVVSLGAGLYSVPASKPGLAYTVRCRPTWSCSCPAGSNGRACYHQAAVWLAGRSKAAWEGSDASAEKPAPPAENPKVASPFCLNCDSDLSAPCSCRNAPPPTNEDLPPWEDRSKDCRVCGSAENEPCSCRNAPVLYCEICNGGLDDEGRCLDNILFATHLAPAAAR